MFFKQIYDPKLSQYSYIVACQQTGEAIIIDPKRLMTDYESIAKEEGLHIKKVTETHIHADFASGLREAADYYQATPYVSDEGDDEWKYDNMPDTTVFLKEDDIIQVGNIELKVIHTPGHTPESISFLLYDRGGSKVPMGLFTGDFLFVGDVGRPDLMEKTLGVANNAALSAEEMYQSLKKLENYPDYLQIWPGHGAGSSCGKALGAVPISTLGYEKQNNWAFQHTNVETFKDELLDGQSEPPTYYGHMKKINKEGFPAFKLKDIPVKPSVNLQHQMFDLRDKESFAQAFKQGAINIPFNKKFVQHSGWYLDYDQALTVIADPQDSEAIQRDLASIGFDKLEQIIPIEEFEKYTDDSYEKVRAEELIENYQRKNILDVRAANEYKEGHLDKAHNIHFGHLDTADIPFDKEETIYVYCQSGVRSAVAVSALKKRDYKNTVLVEGGYKDIEKLVEEEK